MSAALGRIPGMHAALARGRREARRGWADPGPRPARRRGTTSYIVGAAYDAGGEQLAEVHLSGADAYDFTARCLAWAARRAAREGVRVTGAAGPIEAFGLEALEAGCAEAGLARVEA